MHLIVFIALGVFGGLWLFVRWCEWREVRRERRARLRLYPKPPRSRPAWVPIWIGATVVAVIIAVLVNAT